MFPSERVLADVKALKTPVLVIAGDADVTTLEHSVAMFRLLGGGGMGDMVDMETAPGISPRDTAGDVTHGRHHAGRSASWIHRAVSDRANAEGILRAVGRKVCPFGPVKEFHDDAQLTGSVQGTASMSGFCAARRRLPNEEL